MALKKGKEVATIDVALVTVTTSGASPVELALTTANKVDVTVVTEVTDAVKKVVKGILIAQKPKTTTITGHTVVLSDNVFNALLVKVLQGGTIKYDDVEPTKIIGYTPPVAGSGEVGEVFTLNVYSAIYNAAGIVTGYEKIAYPNCQGEPVALSSEDGAFRAPAYTINSAPDTGEAPYDLDYVTTLPVVA